MQTICTTATTTVTQLYDAVKVRRIRIWGSNPPDGTVVYVGVVFAGSVAGTFGANLSHSGCSIGMTIPAYVDARPDRLSQAAQWQSGDTSAGNIGLFTITLSSTNLSSTATVDVTIDVHVTLRMTKDTRTSGNTVSVSAGTLTGFYHLPLDSAAGGTGALGKVWLPDPGLVQTS